MSLEVPLDDPKEDLPDLGFLIVAEDTHGPKPGKQRNPQPVQRLGATPPARQRAGRNVVFRLFTDDHNWAPCVDHPSDSRRVLLPALSFVSAVLGRGDFYGTHEQEVAPP